MSLVAATRSEHTKLFTTSAWWILALVLVIYLGGSAAAVAFVFSGSAAGTLSGQGGAPIAAEGLDVLLYSLSSTIGYFFPLLLGTLIVTAEFRQKTLTPTFLATPRRGTVLWAKIVTAITVGALFGVLALIATVAPSALFLAINDLPTGLDDPDTWALLGRVLIAFVLWAIIGIGIGALVRNQVVAIVVVLAFTQLIEPIARLAVSLLEGFEEVVNYLPGAASDALVGASLFSAMQGGDPGVEWWVGGVTLAAYAIVFVVLGYLASWRRDVD